MAFGVLQKLKCSSSIIGFQSWWFSTTRVSDIHTDFRGVSKITRVPVGMAYENTSIMLDMVAHSFNPGAGGEVQRNAEFC